MNPSAQETQNGYDYCHSNESGNVQEYYRKIGLLNLINIKTNLK